MATRAGGISGETSKPTGLSRFNGYPPSVERPRPTDDPVGCREQYPGSGSADQSGQTGQRQRKAQLNMVREAVLAFNGDVQVEAFSSLKKQGVDKLRQKLDSWFSELAPVEEIQDGE